MNKNDKTKHKWNIADSITSVRIVSSIFLLFFSSRSLPFIIIYTLTGLTDVFDGFIARKTGKTSDFGARLDSIADLIFYSVLIIRLLPVLIKLLPAAVWYLFALTLIVRLASYITAAVKFHRFASVHTWLNKLTGLCVFLIPYMLIFSRGVIYCFIICSLGLLASSEELLIHLTHKDYDPQRKSLFIKITKSQKKSEEQNSSTIV